MQIGGQGGAGAEIGVPQWPVPGTDLLDRELAPRVKLEQVDTPIKHLAAKEERGI